MSRHLLKIVYGVILMLFGAGLIVGFVAGRASAPDRSGACSAMADNR